MTRYANQIMPWAPISELDKFDNKHVLVGIFQQANVKALHKKRLNHLAQMKGFLFISQ